MSILFLFALGAADLAGLVEQMEQLRRAGDEAAVARLVPLVRAELEQNRGPQAALAWNQLGISYSTRGDFVKAEHAYRSAIRLAELNDAKDVLSLALTNLAQDLLTNGKSPAQADMLLHRALSIARAHYGTESPELTEVLYVLAAAKHRMGDRSAAAHYYELSLGLTGESPRGRIRRAYILASVAALQTEEKKFGAARDSLIEGIQLIERYLGPAHPDLIAPLVSLGRVYSKVREWELAQAALDRAEEITGIRLGSGHWLMAEVLNSKVVILRQTGQRVMAKKLEARAEAIQAAQQRNPSRDFEIHVSDLKRK